MNLREIAEPWIARQIITKRIGLLFYLFIYLFIFGGIRV
jgi:hypothetical protein